MPDRPAQRPIGIPEKNRANRANQEEWPLPFVIPLIFYLSRILYVSGERAEVAKAMNRFVKSM